MVDQVPASIPIPVLLGRLGRHSAQVDIEVGNVDDVALSLEQKGWSQKACPAKLEHEKKLAGAKTSLKFPECVEWVVLTTGMILALAQGISAPAIALFTGRSIATMTVYNTEASLVDAMSPSLIQIGVLAIMQFFFAFGWQTCLSWAAAKQARRWHRSFLAALLSQDVCWYDDHEPAGMATKLEGDVANVYVFMSTALGYLIASLGQSVAGLSLALYFGWQLSLVVCATIPILICAGNCMGKEIEQKTAMQIADFARASAVAEESLLAIRTVAAFGGESVQSARFEKELLSAKRGGIRSGMRIGTAWGGLNFFYSCLYALALWFGGHVLMSDRSSGIGPSEIVTVMISMMVGGSGFSAFSGYAPVMARALVSFRGMREMIKSERRIEQPLYTPASLAVLPQELQRIETVEFRNVGFKYPNRPDQWVLSDFSFRMERGQKIALAGESGCGKSTTIQLLERFYDPCEGEVLVNGVNLNQVPIKAWRQLVGYVGQEPVLFATTAMQNLKAGDDSITDEMAVKAAKAAQIHDTLCRLPQGFDTFVGAGGGLLSGGQRQRLAIARALAKNPQILVLDEATSALDSESERMVQATLDTLNTGPLGQCTTIAIAHRLSTIKSSDMIYVMQGGSCCEQGNHEQLMEQKGVYYSMAKLQQARTQEESERPSPNRVISPASFLEPAIAPNEDQAGTTSQIWCRLLHRMQNYWWIWPIAVVIVVAEALGMPLQAVFFNSAIMSLFGNGKQEVMHSELDRAVFCLVMVGLASGVFTLLQNSLFTYVQECLCMILRQEAFATTLRMDMAFFDAPENQTTSILVSLERHMNRVGQMLGIQLGNSMGAIFTCFLAIVLSFCGCWVLASAALLFLPFCGVLMFLVAAAALRNEPEAEEVYGKAGQTTSEAATCIRTVRALGAEERILEIIDTSLEKLTELNTAKSWKLGLSLGLNLSIFPLIFLAGFWMSAVCIQYWGFDAGQVLLTLFCVVFGVMSVSSIVQYIPDSASGYHSAKEVFRLVDQVSKIDAVQPTQALESIGDGSIQFQDVHFWYPHRPEVRVLKKLNFTIHAGQSVAFVGFSGSGKSTVIQLLQRFYDPQCGSIRVGGIELRDLNVAWWRRQLGVVAQEPVLFDVSLEENVRYGCPEATDAQVREAARAANMDYVFSDGSNALSGVNSGAVKWTDRVGLRGEKLSGGQKQRCAIARALLREPQIMLLDEAMSALDSVSESLVQQAMQKSRVGKTTITVAHRLSTILNSDTIYVLSNGRLVESGTYDELISLRGNFSMLARSL
ncbi:Multidrug resistance protein 1A [Symbiodinium microadriaticum]|uniref:Multidrug resistance protein 1A n=1 Tax=Symbiodinium microadriaticum TaxID=2951 RepID=A0A1Q9C625_SYMMI|nr:Multidrug resistance protein 1A [Symbiodinium microadriaticum]CAE7376068.1 Abcb1a [Symbiodinium microadriaticum]CAE7947880.1 Abcb1a [Symbiodinium sp. KB8]